MPRKNIIFLFYPATSGKPCSKSPAGANWSLSCEGNEEEPGVLELGQSLAKASLVFRAMNRYLNSGPLK